MSITTIIVDLDRTLLRTDKTISPYTVSVLKACKGSGIRLIVATARPLRTARPYCELIDFDAMVVSNGARVIWGNQKKEHGISPQSAAQLLEPLLRQFDLPVTLETGNCAYSNKPVADYATILCDDLIGRAQTEGALKILVHIDSPETLTAIKNMLPDDLYHTTANGCLMQIMSKSATKWNGIKAILDILKCAPDDAAYFGDDCDDIEPLKMCGTGIAVSNGIAEAKAAADHIADSNDADGVAKFIEQRLLQKP